MNSIFAVAVGGAIGSVLRYLFNIQVTRAFGETPEVEAVPVALDGGAEGWVLPDDTDEIALPEPAAALLPGLDPTTMGWFERDWYLGPHRDQLFDRNGNGGPTAWWDGRIVGGWRQDAAGNVELQLLEDPGADGRRALEAEADRLGAWLGGIRVPPRFPSPLSKADGPVIAP